MGVNLKDLLITEPVELNKLKNKVVAVDSLNWIFQFLSTIRQRDGGLLTDSEGRVTSHLSGLFYRCSMLLKYGIKPVFVFDGKPPEFKRKTIQNRKEKKEKYRGDYEIALKEGDMKKAFSLASRTSFVDGDILSSAKSLLKLMGIPSITAPSEGEAQCSYMNQEGVVDYVATQDYDSILFGAKKIIRNLNVTGRRRIPFKKEYVLVLPEIVNVEENLLALDLTREQLIIMAMLIGNDYTDGVKGIGPKKALKEVRSGEDIIKKFSLDKNIINWFKKPKTADIDFQFGTIDESKLKDFLLSYEFSEDRISTTLKNISETKGKSQSSLKSFLDGGKNV